MCRRAPCARQGCKQGQRGAQGHVAQPGGQAQRRLAGLPAMVTSRAGGSARTAEAGAPKRALDMEAMPSLGPCSQGARLVGLQG